VIRKRFHKTVGVAIAVLLLIAGSIPASAACPAGCCSTPVSMGHSPAGPSRVESQGCCNNTSPMPCCHVAGRSEDVRQPMAMHAARQADSPVMVAMITATAESDLWKVYESAFASSLKEGPRAGPVPVFLLNLSLLI